MTQPRVSVHGVPSFPLGLDENVVAYFALNQASLVLLMTGTNDMALNVDLAAG